MGGQDLRRLRLVHRCGLRLEAGLRDQVLEPDGDQFVIGPAR